MLQQRVTKMPATSQNKIVETATSREQVEIADLTRLINKLVSLVPGDHDNTFFFGDLSHAQLVERVRAEVRLRKLRCELLGVPQDMFSMPAWEILTELLLAELLGQQNNVSTVGLEAGIPQSTAQRWLVLLEKRNLVRRRRDFMDKRRQWIGLTPSAYKALCRYFAA